MSDKPRLASIAADKGFIVLHLTDGDTRTITVDEALDRAGAIKGLTTEAEEDRQYNNALYKEFMEKTLEAVQQQESLKKTGLYTDFAVKRHNIRQMELYQAAQNLS
jgi:hypothetical protein